MKNNRFSNPNKLPPRPTPATGIGSLKAIMSTSSLTQTREECPSTSISTRGPTKTHPSSHTSSPTSSTSSRIKKSQSQDAQRVEGLDPVKINK